MWPQARAVRVLVLTWRGDPTARQEKAKLDRDVGGLEPFLEGMPTVFVIAGMSYYKGGCQKVICQLFKECTSKAKAKYNKYSCVQLGA